MAAGLANPSKQAEGVAANSMVPPKLKIYTDGGFADVEGFSLGNLQPEVVVIGSAPPAPPADADAAAKAEARTKPPSNNVAILALQTRRNEEKPDVYQVFGRVHNYRAEDIATEAKLFKHDPAKPGSAPTLIDAVGLKVGKQGDSSFNFDLPDTGATELEVRLDIQDDLPLDNRAFTLIGAPRKAQILAVTAGNRYLVDTLRTPLAAARADVIVASPDDYKTEAFKRDVAAGRFDLVIYDRFRPETPPEANALYFGSLPPGPAYATSRTVEGPSILDVNASHPLMQYIRDLSLVKVMKATIVEPPPGSSILFECDSGPLAFVAPRGGFSDAVVAFDLVDGRTFNTDWIIKSSFPLFLFNALQALGNARESASEEVHSPGVPVLLRAEGSPATLEIIDPTGKSVAKASRSPQGTYLFNEANVTGVYHARWAPDGLQAFAVNQFDRRESDLAPRGLVPRRNAGRPGGGLQDQDRLQPRGRHPPFHHGPSRVVETPCLPGPERRLPGMVYLQPPGLHLKRFSMGGADLPSGGHAIQDSPGFPVHVDSSHPGYRWSLAGSGANARRPGGWPICPARSRAGQPSIGAFRVITMVTPPGLFMPRSGWGERWTRSRRRIRDIWLASPGKWDKNGGDGPIQRQGTRTGSVRLGAGREPGAEPRRSRSRRRPDGGRPGRGRFLEGRRARSGRLPGDLRSPPRYLDGSGDPPGGRPGSVPGPDRTCGGLARPPETDHDPRRLGGSPDVNHRESCRSRPAPTRTIAGRGMGTLRPITTRSLRHRPWRFSLSTATASGRKCLAGSPRPGTI